MLTFTSLAIVPLLQVTNYKCSFRVVRLVPLLLGILLVVVPDLPESVPCRSSTDDNISFVLAPFLSSSPQFAVQSVPGTAAVHHVNDVRH